MYNEWPRAKTDKNLIAITRFSCDKVLFHIFYHYWGKESCPLYQGLCLMEVHYIEVPLHHHYYVERYKNTIQMEPLWYNICLVLLISSSFFLNCPLLGEKGLLCIGLYLFTSDSFGRIDIIRRS